MMLDDFLDTARLFSGRDLLPEKALRVWGSVARKLPDNISREVIFECRLSDCDEIDLSLRVTPHRGNVSNAGEGRTFLTDGVALAEAPVWRRLDTFLHDWHVDSTQHPFGTDALGLEFDYRTALEDLPVPNVFFNLNPARADGPNALDDDYHDYLRGALEQLTAAPMDDGVLAALRHCVDLKPAQTRVLLLAVLLGRPGTAVRLCIVGSDWSELRGYLDELGLGCHSPVDDRLVRDLVEPAEHLVLHLDVGSALSQRIGIECYFPCSPNRLGPLANALEALVAEGLAQRAKTRGLLAWPGTCYLTKPTSLLPERIERVVSHIKLTFDAARVTAKGYFSLVKTPLTMANPRRMVDQLGQLQM